MQLTSIACDNCGSDLSVSNKPRTRYTLSEHHVPLYRLPHIERWEPQIDLNVDKHFCDLRCLNNWTASLQGVSTLIPVSTGSPSTVLDAVGPPISAGKGKISPE